MSASFAVPGTAQELSSELDRFEARAVLRRLDEPQDGGGLEKPIAGVLRARALGLLERYGAAYEVLGDVRALRELGERERIEAQVLTARVLRNASPLVDHALGLALAAADSAQRGGDAFAHVAVEARVEAALLFARKRCRKLAETELEKALAIGASLDRVHAARAEVALGFDERATAKAAFEEAAQCGDEGLRRGKLGLVRLHTILGEFDAAAAVMRELGPRPAGDLYAKRVRYRLVASCAKWLEVVDAIDDFVSVAPDADGARGLRLERASALYRAGEIDRARAAWAELAEQSDDWAARAASRTLVKLERADAKRTRLVAFPSVAQLRNHCGPASVELCMRFFGVSADQVAVAREIKHPDGGTPVHKMRAYLDSAGFITRRIEADLAKLKAILDAGVPVILEEDYSTTRHVAVAIGYDDRRELLEVQDPMTHEIRETPYEELPKLREFSNHGALVAVPKGREDLIAELDACDAVECDYMTKTDLAWAAYDQGKPEEGDRLAEEAIALHEPYELAWVYRFTRARDRYDAESTPANMEALGEVLNAILHLWPGDEWPQQFLGRVYSLEERWGEALSAFERARDRDPDDANNWCSIGDAQLHLNDREAAKKSFEEALRRDPGHIRANENLANAAFDAGDLALASVLNDCALELHADNPFNHHVRGRILGKRGEAMAAADAYRTALGLAPGSQYYTVERARFLAKAGAIDEALTSLREASASDTKDTYVPVQLADLAYEHDRIEECLAACALIEERAPNGATARAIGGAARAKKGDLDEGVALMREAIRLRPTYAWAFREMGRAFGRAGRYDEAIAACAAAVGFQSNALGTFHLGNALAGAGHLEDAAATLRRAALTGELGERELLRVTEVVRSAEGAGSTHQFLGELAEKFPRDAGVLRAHLHLLLELVWHPSVAAPIVSKLSELAPEDPFVLAKSGDDLMDAAIDSEARGESLLRRAIEREPSLVTPRRMLARQLNARGRFEEALAVLEPCATDDDDTTEDRVNALIGLGRGERVRATIDEYVIHAPEGERDKLRRPLEYLVAKSERRFADALVLAEALSSDEGELADDGELGRWEAERFACLVAVGRGDEAYEFGSAQCADAGDRGRLAYDALVHDDYALAEKMAREALEEDENEVHALHILARVAELGGDVGEATRIWERMRAISTWHIHVENLGRVALANGDMDRARELLEASVASGHVCPVSLQLRAELRLLSGDREGAKSDALRARACLQPELRPVSEQLDALIAGLAGKRDEAFALFDGYLARESLSKIDRALYGKVREALGALEQVR